MGYCTVELAGCSTTQHAAHAKTSREKISGRTASEEDTTTGWTSSGNIGTAREHGRRPSSRKGSGLALGCTPAMPRLQG
jgi:hypothetical protein